MGIVDVGRNKRDSIGHFFGHKELHIVWLSSAMDEKRDHKSAMHHYRRHCFFFLKIERLLLPSLKRASTLSLSSSAHKKVLVDARKS